MHRDKCTASQAERKVAAQMPLHLKEGKSQYVLDNSGSRSHCQHQVGVQDCCYWLHVDVGGVPFCMSGPQLCPILEVPACGSTLTCQIVGHPLPARDTLSADAFFTVSQVLQLANQLQGKYKMIGTATSPIAFLGVVWIVMKAVGTT